MDSSLPGVIVCASCGHVGTLAPGPGRRRQAACRSCGSLERHRALAALLPAVAHHLTGGVLLDVAPTPPLTSGALRSMAHDASSIYVGMDFDPAADDREVTLQASLTDVPLRDGAVDLAVCYHVLEHIPDDARAIESLTRTLSASGLVLVQVPHRPGVPTDEDPDAAAELRVSRFGQADHVRYYGEDFESRLRAHGLVVQALTMADLFEDDVRPLLGIRPEESIWLGSHGTSVDLRALQAHCATSARDFLAAGLTGAAAERDRALRHSKSLEGRLASAVKQRDAAADRELWLRSHPYVALGSRVARIARRVRRPFRISKP